MKTKDFLQNFTPLLIGLNSFFSQLWLLEFDKMLIFFCQTIPSFILSKYFFRYKMKCNGWAIAAAESISGFYHHRLEDSFYGLKIVSADKLKGPFF